MIVIPFLGRIFCAIATPAATKKLFHKILELLDDSSLKIYEVH
jgi:hypothetical protein